MRNLNSKYKASFTLVELMIVIAILAILSAIVIFTLNPTEIFKKNRDSRRMADLQSLNKALVFMPTWNDSISLGNPNTIYLSLPDASSTCTAYSLPTLPTGFTYNCVTTANLQKTDGTGWVPVDFEIQAGNFYLSALPVDPVNSINYYYSYNPGGSFELNTFFETTDFNTKYGNADGGDSTAYELGTNIKSMPNVFPHNWIKVPGNSLYGTSDFWVMQYEAKYAVDGRTGSDAPAECKLSYDVWHYNKTSGGCNVVWDNKNIVSSPFGSVVTGITYEEAVSACEDIGARLITNREWMTIARNIEQQPSNWTSGIVGTGSLFVGNGGQPESPGYGGPGLDKGINRNPLAILKLSNNNLIYDFSGNASEYVRMDLIGTLLNNQPNTSANNGVLRSMGDLTSLTGYGDLSYDLIRPSDNTWGISKGMGYIGHWDGGSANPNRVIIRGGVWGMGNAVGVFSASLLTNTTSEISGVGFRCVK